MRHFSSNGFFAVEGGASPEAKEELEEYGEGMKEQLWRLGKMLIKTVVGWLSGFEGHWTFLVAPGFSEG